MKERIIDLHVHTNASDGEYSVTEVIKRAIKNNVDTIAITDHDTVMGLKQMDDSSYIRKVVELERIEIIDGIELSAIPVNKPKKKGEQFHILGLGIDPYNKRLNERLDELNRKALYAVLGLIVQLKNDFGVEFKREDIARLTNQSRNLGRPDIAKLCVEYGLAKDVDDAFQKYLHYSYTKIQNAGGGKGIPYQECLDLITNSGGIPILAHPKSLKLEEKEFLKLLRDMIDNGLRGIEVFHSSHTEQEMDYYNKIAEEYNLLISGGSDYHGPLVKPDIELGAKNQKNHYLKQKDLSVLSEVRRRR